MRAAYTGRPVRYVPTVLRAIPPPREVAYAICHPRGESFVIRVGPTLDLKELLETVGHLGSSDCIVRYGKNNRYRVLYRWAGKAWELQRLFRQVCVRT